MENKYLVTYYNRALEISNEKEFVNVNEAKEFAKAIESLCEIENVKLQMQTYIDFN